jgi:PilZ domain-containing protein
MDDRILRERRRFHVSFPVQLWKRYASESAPWTDGHPAEAERTLTENISAKGCLLPLHHELPLGTCLDLEIEIPDLGATPREIKLHCEAKVVRVEREPIHGRVRVGCEIENYWFSESGTESQNGSCRLMGTAAANAVLQDRAQIPCGELPSATRYGDSRFEGTEEIRMHGARREVIRRDTILKPRLSASSH